MVNKLPLYEMVWQFWDTANLNRMKKGLRLIFYTTILLLSTCHIMND